MNWSDFSDSAHQVRQTVTGWAIPDWHRLRNTTEKWTWDVVSAAAALREEWRGEVDTSAQEAGCLTDLWTLRLCAGNYYSLKTQKGLKYLSVGPSMLPSTLQKKKKNQLRQRQQSEPVTLWDFAEYWCRAKLIPISLSNALLMDTYSMSFVSARWKANLTFWGGWWEGKSTRVPPSWSIFSSVSEVRGITSLFVEWSLSLFNSNYYVCPHLLVFTTGVFYSIFAHTDFQIIFSFLWEKSYWACLRQHISVTEFVAKISRAVKIIMISSSSSSTFTSFCIWCHSEKVQPLETGR